MQNVQQKHIVIVGGGSAGWLTAGLIAAKFQSQSPPFFKVTLVESPDVSTVGVGEGTWPSMRHSLQQIGLSEIEFITHCDASFKQGSSFSGWRNGQTDDHYVHPFTTPPGYLETDLAAGWQSLYPTRQYADIVSAQSHVCNAQKAPKQLQTPEYAGVTNYGYHFNADKFVELLKSHCITKLGVEHLVDHVSGVVAHENNDIQAVLCKQSGKLAGDLFIDCSGMRALLIGDHYNSRWIDQQHILFNDSAIATRAPYSDQGADIASTTIATAKTAGWIWDIGLQNRKGVGYVYSSQHCSDEQAQQQLLDYLNKHLSADQAAQIQPRKLSFKPGYREHFWVGNCVAVGMSAGFIEPLEASALALVELSVNMLCDHLPSTFEQMPVVRKRFNQRFTYRWQRVIDFIKLHYVISERNDSAYWRDNRAPESFPESLQELLAVWQHQAPSRYDFIENEEVFPSASYQYVLYGMQFKTQFKPSRTQAHEIAQCQRLFAHNQEQVAKLLHGLPSNRQWLTSKIAPELTAVGYANA